MLILNNLRSVLHDTKTRLQSMPRNWRPRHTLISILLLGLLQSMIFAVIIPPWWHYDEPGHFEYVWLVANLPAWPKVGQYDQTMRLEMANSMTKVGWYKARLNNPDLSGTAPVPIGVPEVGGEPAYYFLAALPLRLMHNADITLQYYAARLVSIILYLLILLVAWYALGEIVVEDHPLRWMVPVSLVLLPAFVDVMTAVSNDVASVLASSLFLWASLRLIKRGFSIGGLSLVGAVLIFCYLSKNTAWFTFLLLPFVLIFSLLRGRFTRLVIGISILGTIVAGLAVLRWDAPLGWYQSSVQSSPLRIASSNASLGNYIFQIDSYGTNTSGQLSQSLLPDEVKFIRGQTVTLGAWFWANQSVQITSPYLTFTSNANGTLSFNPISSPQTQMDLNITPTFYRFVIRVPNDAVNATLFIPYSLPSHDSKIFLDGLVLASGEHSGTAPHFSDPNGTRGTWDGNQFQNLIRNGSAEQNSPRFLPAVEDKLNKFSPAQVDLPVTLESLFDWSGTGWYYHVTFGTLFRTFWASLAADKVLIPASSNYMLMLLTILGAVGAGLLVWRKRKSMEWDILFLLGLSFLMVWVFAFIRGASGTAGGFPVFSWARYTDPAILPSALILCAGWLEWLELIKARWMLPNATSGAIFLGGMFGISALAIVDAIQTFHPEWWASWASLAFLLIVQVVAIRVIIHGKARLNP
jgi:hypothetical protein